MSLEPSNILTISTIDSFLNASQNVSKKSSGIWIKRADDGNWTEAHSRSERTEKLDDIFHKLEKDLEEFMRLDKGDSNLAGKLKALEARVDELKARFDKTAGIFGRLFSKRYETITQSYVHLKNYLTSLQQVQLSHLSNKISDPSSIYRIKQQFLVTTKSRSELYKACIKGDVKKAEKLLREDVDSEVFQDQSGQYFLHVAAANGHVEICDLLLKNGLNVNVFDKEGLTPLHVAAMYGQTKVITFLISRNAKLDQLNYYGETPLLYAYRNNSHAYDLLIPFARHTKSQENLNRLLQAAVCKGDVAFIEKLIKNEKVDLKTKNHDGENLFHLAVKHDKTKVVKFLIQHLKDQPKILQRLINSSDKNGNTPLHFACLYDRSFLSGSSLIEANANLKIKNSKGETPLHLACKSHNLEIVKRLIKDKKDLESRDLDGNTPFLIACRYGTWDLIHYLHDEKRAKIKVKNHFSSNPLHQVCYNAAEGASNLIHEVAKGSKIREWLYIPDKKGDYLLHIAAKAGNIQTVKILLEFFSDQIDRKNAHGEHALTMAINAKNIEIAEILFSYMDFASHSIEEWQVMLNKIEAQDIGNLSDSEQIKWKNLRVVMKSKIKAHQK